MPWLLVVGGQVQGSCVSGMREAARAADLVGFLLYAHTTAQEQTYIKYKLLLEQLPSSRTHSLLPCT